MWHFYYIIFWFQQVSHFIIISKYVEQKLSFDRWVYNAIASNNIYFVYITIHPQTFKYITKKQKQSSCTQYIWFSIKHSDVIISMLWYFKEIDWDTILFISWIQKTFMQSMDVHRFTGHSEVLIWSSRFLQTCPIHDYNEL